MLLASAEGDHAQFSELYRRTSAKLFGVVLRICPDRGLAEDVLTDVYLTIWRRAGAFDPGRASPITWMATIARNRAIDAVRRLPRGVHVDVDAAIGLADGNAPADAALIAAEGDARLHLCVDRLEEPQAGAIRAAFLHGFTYAQLATTMAVPLGTMKSWIRRGLIRLKECLHADD
jgi:RNA polymerase sigma factor (sigma-70 family)